MKFGRFYNANNINCAVSNVAHGNGIVTAYSTPVDFYDAVEDARNAKELLANLNTLKLVGWNNLVVDRETESYVRVKGTDVLGNVHYLKVLKGEAK